MDNKAKFLGLIFDSKLKWYHHIAYIADKCKSRLQLMRSVAGNSWGASKKSLLTIYKALIRPLFDYGAVAYDSASNSVKSKLDIIQAKSLRICCAAISSSTTSAVLFR